ncbi:tubulin monoglutamylase TTLL4-like [Brevipalpus obovatus]|uniref:tubulin monoglutamylase TTLL4-like n=1 Tax=Brevipalpus obovatus TaxID=246614 RepID=UPI003D9EA897
MLKMSVDEDKYTNGYLLNVPLLANLDIHSNGDDNDKIVAENGDDVHDVNGANGDDVNGGKETNEYAFPRTFVETEECDQSDGKKKIQLLQNSLFHHSCPTIYFGLKDEEISIPDDIRKLLIWRLSAITPHLIKETVTRSGFKLIKEKNSERKKWIATWCRHMKSPQFELLNDTQKVNHFPGCYQLGRKDRLSTNLRNFTPMFSGNRADYFHPNTYILPQDLSLLRKRWLLEEIKPKLLILKPPASARGNGVAVINQLVQIPASAKVRKLHSTKSAIVAQEYISNPCILTSNGPKFDLRVYVLVTSFYPLRVYIYPDGLVRFASEPYSVDNDKLDNLFIHVTNYCINKMNESYEPNHCINSRSGHKWSLSTLWKFLKETYPDVNVEQLWNQIIDIVIKTLLTVQGPVFSLARRHLKTPYNGFELLGFDIMLDSHFKPWLLEVNISPSLKSESTLDYVVKSQLIKDVMNTVGYRPPICEKKGSSAKCFHRSLTLDKLLGSEQEKQTVFKSIHQFDLEILDDLSIRDLLCLAEAEDELTRCGKFVRILPSIQISKYFAFFTKNSYFDHLLNAWEKQYADNRAKGISLLKNLCLEKISTV